MIIIIGGGMEDLDISKLIDKWLGAEGSGRCDVSADELIKIVEERLDPERIRKFVDDYLRREGLIKVRLVIFKLPTEYLMSKGSFEKTDEGWVEKRLLKIDPARMRTLRKKFYNVLHEIAYRVDDMWALRGDADVKPINDVLNEFHEELKSYGLDIYRSVRIVESYMPRDYVVEKLAEYIEERKMALKEIADKLSMGTLKAMERKRLEKEIAEVEDEIRKLMDELKKLREGITP